MSKHTKGPWKIGAPIWMESEETKNRVITAAEYPICYFHYPFNERDEQDEIAANARLIAAAPEMLEACKSVIQLLHDINLDGGLDKNKDFMKSYNALSAAITKAEGKE